MSNTHGMGDPKATLVSRFGDDALADPDKLDELATQMRRTAEGSKEEGWKVLATTLEACARRLRAYEKKESAERDAQVPQ